MSEYINNQLHLKKILRTLVLFQLFLFIPYTFGYVYQDEYLPKELQDFLYHELDKEYWWMSGIPLIFISVVSISYIISLIGVYRFKQWGKYTFITTMILLTLITSFTGPYVEHGVIQMLSELEMLVNGVILSLLLFTNIFKFESNKSIEK